MSDLPYPRHIVIVMDGNGRWAKQRHLPRIAGHKSGVSATSKIVKYCVRRKISILTIFAFSSENWNRPESEVNGLMSLFVTTLATEVKKLHKQDIRVRFIGDRVRFSKKLQQSIQNAEEKTAENNGLQLNIAANYGGRWDMLNATKTIATKLQRGDIKLESLTEELLSSQMSLAGLAEPDLFIRTGGEQRISNFLLWQLAYTELYFTDTLWPDFGEDDFMQAIQWYCGRQRRFGQTGEQMTEALPAVVQESKPC